MSIDQPPITPQQDEGVHGGGAEAAEISRRRLSRRRFLRRAMLGIIGDERSSRIYPNLTGQFSASLTVGKKTDVPVATPDAFKINQAGVFYRVEAKTSIVHLKKYITFRLKGTNLSDQLASETVLKDTDGSYWIALYQRCVHLGCTVPFRDDCLSFKCPCHGSHDNSDGEDLDGPAPEAWIALPFTLMERM